MDCMILNFFREDFLEMTDDRVLFAYIIERLVSTNRL